MSSDLFHDTVAPLINRVNGWLPIGQARYLFNLAAKLPAESVVVEIGSWQGKSAIVLAHGVGPSGAVFCIDPWEVTGPAYEAAKLTKDDLFELFTRNIQQAGVSEIVRPLRGYSADAALWWKLDGGPIDLLYIDGDHSYDGVMTDLELWVPFLKPGGTLVMHDMYVPDRPRDEGYEAGPWQAADEYLSKQPGRWADANLADRLFNITKLS